MILLVVLQRSCGTLCRRVVRELTVGRRIAFYKIRGEIGCGNFSHVKLGIHALTKGKIFKNYQCYPDALMVQIKQNVIAMLFEFNSESQTFAKTHSLAFYFN